MWVLVGGKVWISVWEKKKQGVFESGCVTWSHYSTYHPPLSSSLIPPSLPALFEVIYDTSGSRRWVLTRQRLYCLLPLLLSVCVCVWVCVVCVCARGCEQFYSPVGVSFFLCGIIIFSPSMIDHSWDFLNISVCKCARVCGKTIDQVEALALFMSHSSRVTRTLTLSLTTCLTDERRILIGGNTAASQGSMSAKAVFWTGWNLF